MRRLSIILILTCSLFLCACSDNAMINAPEKQTIVSTFVVNESFYPSTEDAVALPINKQIYLYCKIVQQAVEAFAENNHGIYPSNVSCDTNSHGDTVIYLLPRGQLLENIFTRCCTEPIDGCSASPGQIGYTVVIYNGECKGYVITGSGRYASRPMITIYKNAETGAVKEILGRHR